MASGASTRSGCTSRRSNTRAPEAMARWSWVNCIVSVRIGSKNRWMYRANATSMPGSMVPSSAICPPNTMAAARPKDMNTSTVGMSEADSRWAVRFVLRCCLFSASNRSKLVFWRFMLWTTRTPSRFSASDALTREMATRTRR